MALMRDVLLWASHNQMLARWVPGLPGVRRAVRRFMPGEELQDALDEAKLLSERGVTTTFTALGENLTEIAESDAVAEHYLNALDAIESSGLDTEISVKLTHLGLDLDFNRTTEHLARLAERLQEMDRWLWVDMEESSYVDRTLDAYRRIQDRFGNVGVCLQAYLHRTPADIAGLRPLKPGIRLVKGAYREATSVALQRKRDMDEAFLGLAVALAHMAAEGEVRAAIATHDVRLLERLSDAATAEGLAKDTYEIQMLYGIRMADQYRYAQSGYPMRDLIAYGSAWYPWYVRRLAERPANLWFVARNMLGSTGAS